MKLLKKINPTIEKQAQELFYVGRLATAEDMASMIERDPIYFKDMHETVIQFHIKCLSPIPPEISSCFAYNHRVITGNTISYNNADMLDAWFNLDKLAHTEKIKTIREGLENKLIAFRLNENYRSEMIFAELYMIEDCEPADSYQVIPGPEMKLGEGKKEFETILLEQKPFTLKEYPKLCPPASYIYTEGALYQTKLKETLNATTYLSSEESDIWYTEELAESFQQMVDLRINQALYFISQSNYEQLVEQFEESKKNLRLQRVSSSGSVVECIPSPTNVAIQKTVPQRPVHLVSAAAKEDELAFIQQLQKNATNRGLYWTEEDLLSFHISAKTNLLTVLGGMSGTGKSQMAKLYGETLNLTYDERLLLVPISPSYHEPSDVLGYFNPTTGQYYESETGLVRLLMRAERHPEELHLVIFDEMNLSQVEHWFSPFISLLEIEEDNRYLTLYQPMEDQPCATHPSRIHIGSNVIFVGTVNFDETTKEFSDRLLDRTNMIVPQKLSFQEAFLLAEQVANHPTFTAMEVATSRYRNDWRTQVQHPLTLLLEDEVQLLDLMHELMSEQDENRGISFRTVLGMAQFLANIPIVEDEPILSRARAFDLQVSQRILPKVNGLASYVEPLVGYVEGDDYYSGLLTELFESERAQNVSTFEKTIAELQSKAKELMLYGYAK